MKGEHRWIVRTNVIDGAGSLTAFGSLLWRSAHEQAEDPEFRQPMCMSDSADFGPVASAS
jgi:hypothetical protein